MSNWYNTFFYRALPPNGGLHGPVEKYIVTPSTSERLGSLHQVKTSLSLLQSRRAAVWAALSSIDDFLCLLFL